ncbi:MAG: hypothetical protein VR78_11085 [Hoeflea sp. BRH_c9]|nr:MAG: hypothetical protein VR78_11085 [Hoeflea sp. BRH_c9]
MRTRPDRRATRTAHREIRLPWSEAQSAQPSRGARNPCVGPEAIPPPPRRQPAAPAREPSNPDPTWPVPLVSPYLS